MLFFGCRAALWLCRVSSILMPVKPIARFYKLVFAALVAGCLIFHLAILWESRHKIAAGYGDFIIFYTGAQIVADGRSRDLFNVETQNAYQAKFDVPQLEWPLPFNHAPYELFLFLPLVHLSFPAAQISPAVAAGLIAGTVKTLPELGKQAESSAGGFAAWMDSVI